MDIPKWTHTDRQTDRPNIHKYQSRALQRVLSQLPTFKTYDPPPTFVPLPLPLFVHLTNIMLLLNAALALAVFAGTAVQAKTIDVSVGASGNTFDPTSVTAADTDIVVFTLYVVSAYPDAHPLLTLLQQGRSPYRHSVDLRGPLQPAFRWCRLWPVSTLPILP